MPSNRTIAARTAIALCCLVAAGCAGLKLASTDGPAQADAAVTSASRDTPAPVTEPEPVAAPAPQAAAEVVRAPAPAPLAAPEIVSAPAPQAAPAAMPATATAPAPAPRAAPETNPLPVTALPAAAPLDFTSLGTRLRQTKTMGVLTKLSVKNEADDLVDEFRGYHRQEGTVTLPELRRSYDMLLLKVLSLVQDGDPPLAQDIVQSRAAIWDILADPMKFTESNLMAGVAP